MKEFFNNIQTYLKQNWLFVLIMLIGSTIIIAQMTQVVLYADDYILGYYNSDGIKSAFEYFTNHYQTWGGGYTSFIVILFTMGSNVWWQLFLSLLLILFVGLTVKMVCKNHPESKWFVAAILWASIFILSIYVSHETIYWLDGAVAYLFSMFQIFIYFYFLYTRIIQGVHKKYDYVLIPILGFFAGWSSAQSGLIAILMPIALIIWQRFIKKQKVHKLFYFTTVLTIIGFLIFYFAPGNSVRMNEFEYYVGLNFFEKIAYRVDSVFGLIFSNTQIDFTAAPLFIYLTIGLVAITDLSFVKTEKNKKLKVLRIFCSVYSLLFLFIFLLSSIGIPILKPLSDHLFSYANLLKMFSGELGSFGFVAIVPYIFSGVAILCSLISSFFIGKRTNSPILGISLLMGYIAEFCMIMAPYSPIRTTFYTITFMWISIGYLFCIAKAERINTFPVIFCIFTIFNVHLGIAVLICYTALRFTLPSFTPEKQFSFSTADIYLFTCVFAFLALINAAQVFINYRTNKKIDDENISLILKRKEYLDAHPTDNPETLYLIRPANDLYGFTGLAGIDWVERSVNLYFDMPINQNIEYEGAHE